MSRRTLILTALLAAAALWSCQQVVYTPRPTIPLVLSIAADTTGPGSLAAHAGQRGADGSIALIGEPEDVIALARRFQRADIRDNVDGRPVRDSLPDFAGESFDAILDVFNAPYTHFLTENPALDSLREAAVRNAVFAWDSTCVKSAQDLEARLHKTRAKILIFTASMQAEWGLFDVDTLQQLCGGRSILLSPAEVLLEQAFADGAHNIGVWTSRDVKASEAWQRVFDRLAPEGANIAVIAPDAALDVRTELRGFLRQYRATGRPLDVLILDKYSIDLSPLQSELNMIRRAGAEEDAAFDKMLSPGFRFLEPGPIIVDQTYRILRERNLFTHRIANPAVHYYQTEESEDGTPCLVEVGAAYVQRAYVSDEH